MSSQNKENHFRLLLLLVDGAALVERKVFDSKVTGTLSSFLSANQGVLNDLNKKKAINASQLTLLNRRNPASGDFDLSLLTCLLRNICGLAKPIDAVWTKPGVNDHSTEADITRLKEHRNKIMHLSEVGKSQSDFQNEWTDICQILTRLNSGLQIYAIPDLKKQLDGFKTCCIDQKIVKQYEHELWEWKELEKAQQNIVLEEILAMKEHIDKQYSVVQSNLEEMKQNQAGQQQEHGRTRDIINETRNDIIKKLEEPKLSSEQERLIEHSKYQFEEADENKKLFVITKSYKEARKKLDTSGIVLLSGHPGEGKTTMAKMLLLESSPVGSILKLSHPSEWPLVPKGYNSILIDDIFGFTIMNEQLLYFWERFLPELIFQARKRKLAAVVITTRHYILNEAKTKLSAREMFPDIITLSSEDLSREERLNILNNHLKANEKVLNEDEKVRICSAEGSDNDKQMIGFPACTAMFTTAGDLFMKGSEFFKSPYEFFLQCLEDIIKNGDKFMSLILVWVSESHIFAASALEPDNITKLVKVAEDFSYTKLRDNAKSLNENLKQLEQCFLTYDDTEETYSFRYHIIADAVGIVAAKNNKKAVIKYGSSSFIMRHVTTSGNSSKHVKLKKQNFMILVEKMNELVFESKHIDSYDITQHHAQLSEIRGMMLSTPGLDISVLQNEAFDNSDFIKEYLNTQKDDIKKNCLRVPILYLCSHFKPEYDISFPKDKMPLCLPAALLALGKDTMVAECIERNLLTEPERNVSLLLAVKDKRFNLVEDLVMKANTEISEEFLKIAANSPYKMELYKFLLPRTINFGDIPHSLMTGMRNLNVKDIDWQYAIGDTYHCRSSSPNQSAKTYNHDLMSYILGCKLLAEGKSDLLSFENIERQTTQSVYYSGWEEFLKKLMQFEPPEGFDNISPESLLEVIARHAHTAVVKILLSNNPFDKYSRLMKSKIAKQSLFHYAVVKSDTLLLQTAIELRLDPNRRDIFGRSPMYLATYYRKEKFVQALLRVQLVDLEMTERNGNTPLHAAVWNNDSQITRLLLRRVNVNCRDDRGNTPLHFACQNCNLDIIRILTTNQRIDVKVVNKRGDTVFHSLMSSIAIRRIISDKEVKRCVMELVNTDLDVIYWLPNLKNKKGETIQLRSMYPMFRFD